MKNIYISLFFICSFVNVNAQVDHQQYKTRTDNTVYSGNYSYDIKARDWYKMSQPFRFSSSNGHSFRARIDETLLYPASYSSSMQTTSNYAFNEGLPVVSINANATVGPTGAASYTVPIDIVQGTAGMQPQLAVTYNSQSGNGLLGWGWHLAGISAITRVNNNMFHDGNMNVGAGFMLDGQRLLPVSSYATTIRNINTSTTLGGVGSAVTSSTLYQTEVNSFSIIRATNSNNQPTQFTISTKDGQTLTYGSSSDSRIARVGSSTGFNHHTWLLKTVEDVHGNYMTYNYGFDSAKGEYWLESIEYTGNRAGVNPYNKVIFYYEERSDVNTTYYIGKHTQSRLLRMIKVFAQGELAWSYDFKYFNNSGELYSRLNKIEKKDRMGTALNPIVIEWDNNQISYEDEYTANSVIKQHLMPEIETPHTFGDFDGDGKDDIAKYETIAKTTPFPSRIQVIRIINILTNQIISEIPISNVLDIYPIDFNKNGKAELLVKQRHSNNVIKFLLYNINENNYELIGTRNFNRTNIGDDDVTYIGYSDFDNDGYNDIVYRENNFLEGYSFYNSTSISHNLGNNRPIITTGDFIGDGNTEIFLFNTLASSNNIRVFSINNTGFSLITSLNKKFHSFQLGDFNGDGKTDVLLFNTVSSPKKWEILYSNGINYSNVESLRSDIGTPNIYRRYIYSRSGYRISSELVNQKVNLVVADINGDGKSDIIEWSNEDRINYDYFNIFYHNGSAWIKRTYNYPQHRNYSVFSIAVADITGNGKKEILLNNEISQQNFSCRYDCMYLGDRNYSKNVAYVQNGLNKHRFIYDNTAKTTNYEAFDNNNFAISPVKLAYAKKLENYINNELISTDEYSFSRAFVHKHGKGFLGFLYSQNEKTIGNNTIISSMSQNYDLENAFLYNEVNMSSFNRNGETKSKTVYSPYSRKRVIRNNPKVYFPLSEEITSTSSYSPDNYIRKIQFSSSGNITKIEDNYGTYKKEKYFYWAVQGVGVFNKLSNEKEVISSSRYNLLEFRNYYSYTGNKLTQIRKYERSDNTPYSLMTTQDFSNHNVFGIPLTESVTKDGSTRATNYVYDNFGRWPLSVTNFKGQQTKYTYNNMWGVVSVTDHLNKTETYSHSTWGELKQKTLADGNKVNYNTSWDVASAYLNKGMYKKTITNPDNTFTTTWFNAQGQSVRTTSNNLVYVDRRYNELGQLTRESFPYSSGSTYSSYSLKAYWYDINGKVVREYNGLNYTYYQYSNTIEETITIDNSAKDYTVTQKYDFMGNMIESTDFGGTISYTNNNLGAPENINYNNNNIVIEYDKYGNQTLLNDPNTATRTYGYDNWGNMTNQTIIQSTGDIIYSYEYDEHDKLRIKNISGEISRYDYTPEGYLKEIITSNGTNEYFAYDNFGRLTAKTAQISGNQYTHSYFYDNLGRMNREQYANGFSVKYDFDQYSRIKTISDYSTGSKIYEINSYNHLDQALTDTRHGNVNSIQSHYTYDLFGRPTKQWNNFYNYSYQYNSNSHNLRSFNNNSVKEYYEYDKDRLKSYGPLTSNNSGALNFAPNGNITLNPAITPDAQDNNITYNPFPNSISTIPLSENQPYLPTNQTIEYTPFNKVSSITDGDYNFTFQYNSNHERVKMEVENDNEVVMTKYYFGPSEIQETSEGTRTINHIGLGSGLLAMHVTNPDGSTEIVQCFTDRLGSPIVLANKNGQEIGRYSYTPWGKQRDPYTLETISFSNQPVSWFHRGYTGHEMLYGIGIINMNGRIYDPHTHQFLSPDNYIQAPGFSQSFNRFAYCVNNPLMYTDPSGEIIFTIIGAIFAPVTGGASLALGIAMDVGGAINLGIKASQGKINSVGDGFAAYGIGAAAGAAGYFTGGAAFAAAGGAAGGAGGFLAGAAAGAAGSAASMPIQSLGNTLYFGDPFITPEQYALGIVTGAALGGTINGGIALKNGRGFWNGSVKPSNIGTPTPTLQIDQPEVKLNTDGMRTQPKPMPDNNRFTVSTRQQDITYTTTDGVKITMSRPDIKGYHPSLAGKTDLYHNYPLSLDKPIIQGGDWAQRVVDGAAWFQAPGTINGTQGMYQIGVNSNGIIFHRVFVPF